MKSTILTLLVVVLIASCKPSEQINEQPKEPIEEPTAEITKELCISADGHWNECGSPCAGADAEICIQVCSQQCECGGITGFNCPAGYKCRLSGKIADEMGVCVKG